MSLWKKGIEGKKEIKQSEELSKKRDELLKKWPAVMEQWEREDSGPVRKAAEEMMVISLIQNAEKILQAKETLKRAIWKRDSIKESFQHSIDEKNGEIETLSAPVIFEKAQEWQSDLSSLRTKKIVEVIEKWTNPETGGRVKYRSNFSAIKKAKEKLSSVFSRLRGMRLTPLTEIFEFIKTTELELQGIDFSILGEETEVSERSYSEITADPETAIYPIGRTYTLIGDKIIKTFK